MTIQDSTELTRLYDEQICSAEVLLALLEDEETALRQRNVEELNECVRRKQELLQQFETDANKRQTLDETLNIEGESKLRERIKNKQEKLRSIMVSVQHQNRVNAGIVKLSQDFTQQMLDIVRGIPPQQAMYNSSGQSKTQSNNQSLAKV